MDILTSMIIIAYAFVPLFKVSIAADSIGLSQSISNGNTLVSQGGTFELGFFTKSNKSYLGIWYKNIRIQKVVWVANRVNPINGSNATLTLNSTGNLVLSQNGSVVWYTTPQKQAHNPVAVLLDTGNLVLRNEGESNPEDYLWQSFDYPSDTLLPGMKLGRNLRLGLDWTLTTWKSPDDPSPGDVSEGLVLHNYPEFYTMKGTEKFFRYGPWNGIEISGIPGSPSTTILDFTFVTNNDEIYYTYSFNNNSVISILVLNQTSTVRYVWDDQDQNWRIYTLDPKDFCDTYGLCGAYGNCMITQLPVCQCFNGFSPKSPQAWISSDWSQGCVRNKPLSCNDTYTDDGFVKFEGLKVPDTTYTWLNESMGLEECRVKCLNNCSCMAYTNSNISGAGSGCVMWFGDLIDMRQFQEGGEDLYVRMSASDIVNNEELEDRSKKNTRSIVAATIVSICGVLLLCIYFIWRIRKKIAVRSQRQLNDLDLPLFDLPTVAAATNDFSMNKKIGEGGFGPVYRGKLLDGREIAVKRLSSLSKQGMTEFINEVKLIVKLQHRNLVKLLGCCIHGQELMLIYEYMANSSLDSFIFADTKGKVLEWPQRFNIICGIARGLVYLHQDSRLRIIHRDLKASNVLLDDSLNPKISDFGMAKTFGGDQTEGNTNRVVGTYGYMAPEYAVDGLFSVKSDVFSFGILLLEVISGRRNRAYYHMDDNLNLVGYAWTLWKEDRPLDLIDIKIGNSCDVSEVLRCIHVSLLCVQQYPEDRPTMASVILMLGSEMELVEPKMPGSISRNVSMETYVRSCSTNEITITLLEAR
ncbi:G-type lectin S-receptor-like serine/threonine-protein kinase At4g27290 [Gastrolobium bilobum]|uniref:G-type lectin S-receptor-like serine/threonine-protein kinase At4g27290 n=1 Tax=Gastrolobium bilobum TaxID=150636 RepID=UPI002AB2C79D|nr:G-type lectin S-receptor-like serine/threonine-protein kinase At4g27290 [Gastrolobium bilobum]